MAKTVCFTGHRPKDLFGYSEGARARYSGLCDEIAAICEKFMDEESVDSFITGGAQGVDQLAFWAVERIKAKRGEGGARNVLYKPFEGQDRNWSADGMFGRGEYARMVERADYVHVCGDGADITGDLLNRNRAMVDSSDILICVWNKPGRPGEGRGGTAACTRYALKRAQKIYVLDLVQGKSYWLN